MRHSVVHVELSATVGGRRLGVESATVKLGVNSIPTVELTCAPTQPASMQALEPNVLRPRLSEYASLYRSLAAEAEGLSTQGEVSIRLMETSTDSSGSDTDSISLKWILAGVGMSSAGATAAPRLSVVLMHPICRLTKLGSIYETPKGNIALNFANTMEQDQAKDPLDALSKAYAWAAEADGQFLPPPPGGEIASEFRTSLGDAQFKPTTYLDWKGKGNFLTTELGTSIMKAIGMTAFATNGGTSIWDVLVSSSGSILASITQDQSRNYTTDKLVMEPTNPWKSVEFSIDESRCSETDLPGMDPFRLIGVMTRKLGPYASVVSAGVYKAGNASQTPQPTAEHVYVPPIDGVSSSSGRIMKVSPPAILESAYRLSPFAGQTISAGGSDADKVMANAYDSAIKPYCQAVYEISAGSMCQGNVRMPVTLRVGGKLLVPGNTCKFVSGGADLYYGYVSGVVHHLSTEGGNSTIVSMTHVRPQAAWMVGGQAAIAAGAESAAYK